jgi:hypothetical protein
MTKTRPLIDGINAYMESGSLEDFCALERLISKDGWHFGAQEIVGKAREALAQSSHSQIDGDSSGGEDVMEYVVRSAEMFSTDLDALRQDPAFTGSGAQIAYMRDLLKFGSDT